jgi:uncharacterized protein YndB with AHSA1/START domain
MSKFSVTSEIAAPPERVWAVMFDVDRWHEWTPSITSVTRVDGRPLELGTRVLIRQPRFPAARWTVTTLEPGKRFEWTSKAPGLRVIGTHAVAPAEAGTVALLSIEIDGMLGGLWESLTREITQKYVTMEARGLKARSEDPSYRHGNG